MMMMMMMMMMMVMMIMIKANRHAKYLGERSILLAAGRSL